MRREDGSYTSEQEALDYAEKSVEFGKSIGVNLPAFVQKRGKDNYLVTPVEYKSFKTLHCVKA